MVDGGKFMKAAGQAYEDVSQFFKDFLPQGAEDRFVVAPDWAHTFAYKIARAAPQVFATSFPKRQYGSWLVVLDNTNPNKPVMAIAINEPQLLLWEKDKPGQEPVCARLQVARTILHETGHIRLQPHLLRPSPQRAPYTGDAEHREEEDAWIYAFVCLAILLGDYAYWARVKFDKDNTPAIGV